MYLRDEQEQFAVELGEPVEHLHPAFDHVVQHSQLVDQVGELWSEAHRTTINNNQ